MSLLSLQPIQSGSSFQSLSTTLISNGTFFDPCSFVSEFSLIKRNVSESIRPQNFCNLTDIIRNLQLENQTTKHTFPHLQKVISNALNETESTYNLFTDILNWVNEGIRNLKGYCNYYTQVYQEQLKAAKEDFSIENPQKTDICATQHNQKETNLCFLVRQLKKNSTNTQQLKEDICHTIKGLLLEEYGPSPNQTDSFETQFFLPINEPSRNFSSSRFRTMALALQQVTCNSYFIAQDLRSDYADFEKELQRIKQLEKHLQLCQSLANTRNSAALTKPKKESLSWRTLLGIASCTAVAIITVGASYLFCKKSCARKEHSFTLLQSSI